MCFVFISEQTATCAIYSINWLVFITEMKSVYSAVRTGSLNKAVCASYLKGWLLLILWSFCTHSSRHSRNITIIIIIIIINPVTLSRINYILQVEIGICDIILKLVTCLWIICIFREPCHGSDRYLLSPHPQEEVRVVSKKYQCEMFGGQSVNATGFSLITLVSPCQNNCIIPATRPFIFLSLRLRNLAVDRVVN